MLDFKKARTGCVITVQAMASFCKTCMIVDASINVSTEYGINVPAGIIATLHAKINQNQ